MLTLIEKTTKQSGFTSDKKNSGAPERQFVFLFVRLLCVNLFFCLHYTSDCPFVSFLRSRNITGKTILILH